MARRPISCGTTGTFPISAPVCAPAPKKSFRARSSIASTPGCTSRGEVHGPLTVRLAIAADGAVAEARPLVDRVVTAAGGDARPAVESIFRDIRELRFAPRAQPSEAWIPIMLGGTLGRVDEQRGSEPAAAPEA
jgi:hypothetical protein